MHKFVRYFGYQLVFLFIALPLIASGENHFWAFLVLLLMVMVEGVIRRAAVRKKKENAAKSAKRKLEIQNREEIRDMVERLTLELERAYEEEKARNISEALDAFPALMATVEEEEAFLKDIVKRHPNISGFVQTRSVGASKSSSVAELGRFLKRQEATN